MPWSEHEDAVRLQHWWRKQWQECRKQYWLTISSWTAPSLAWFCRRVNAHRRQAYEGPFPVPPSFPCPAEFPAPPCCKCEVPRAVKSGAACREVRCLQWPLAPCAVNARVAYSVCSCGSSDSAAAPKAENCGLRVHAEWMVTCSRKRWYVHAVGNGGVCVRVESPN